MTKYEPLWKLVQGFDTDYIELTFEDIKNLCGVEIESDIYDNLKDIHRFGYFIGKIYRPDKWISFVKITKDNFKSKQ